MESPTFYTDFILIQIRNYMNIADGITRNECYIFYYSM